MIRFFKDLCYNYYISEKQRSNKSISTSAILCKNCKEKERAIDRTNKIQQTPSPTKTHASSRAPFSSLTPEEMNLRLKSLTNNKRSIVKEYSYASKVDSSNNIDKMVEGSLLKKVIHNAQQYLRESANQVKKSILKTLLELEYHPIKKKLSDTTEKALTEQQHQRIEEQASFILGQMQNLGKAFSQRKNGIRYCAATLRLGVSLYLQSPKAKEEVDASELMMFPSKRTIQNTIKERRPLEGRDIVTFSMFTMCIPL